jgi:DNA repair exonuclease SbcCD ATPase subunit
MSERVSSEDVQGVVNERLPADQNYTEEFVQALALDLLDSRAMVKELEDDLRISEMNEETMNGVCAKTEARVKELEALGRQASDEISGREIHCINGQVHPAEVVPNGDRCVYCDLFGARARVKELEAVTDLHALTTVMQEQQRLQERVERAEAKVKELAEKWTHDMREAGRRIKELKETIEQFQRGGWWCRHDHWHAREGLSCCGDLSDDQDAERALRGEEER